MSEKHISVRVDERVFRIVRNYAQRRNLTVPDLIEGFLESLAEREQRALAARAQIRARNTNRPVSIEPPRQPDDDDD